MVSTTHHKHSFLGWFIIFLELRQCATKSCSCHEPRDAPCLPFISVDISSPTGALVTLVDVPDGTSKPFLRSAEVAGGWSAPTRRWWSASKQYSICLHCYSCMYVCMYGCMYVRTYVCMYVCIWYIYSVHVYISIIMWIYIYICTYL